MYKLAAKPEKKPRRPPHNHVSPRCIYFLYHIRVILVFLIFFWSCMIP